MTVTETRRDMAWSLILHELADKGSVQLKNMEADESFKRTISRTLKSMEEMGWLERDSPRAHTYYPSKRFNRICSHVLVQASE